MPTSRVPSVVLALVALITSLAPSCAEPPPPNVVILLLDTVRPDYLSVYGHPRPTSPFLEKFARDATKYERAYSTSSWTLPAHASMFSGSLPQVHQATQRTQRVADEVPLLAERLAQAGYQTAGFSNNPWVSERTGLARGFQTFQDRLRKRARPDKRVESHQTLRAVQDWFKDTRKPEQPYFLFVNLMDAHMPYGATWEFAEPFFSSEAEYDAAVQRFFPNGGTQAIMFRNYERTEPLSEGEWTAFRSLYEASLRLTDRVTEKIVEVVDGASEPDDTIVLVLSDHGENLGDHGHISHMFNVYDSNLRIACLARGRGFERGAVESRLVHITDVYPTVLSSAGLAPEPGIVGIDLRRDLPRTRLMSASLDVPVISINFFPAAMQKSGILDAYKRELWAAVGQRYKMIRGSDGSEEVYDILADPHEQHPLDMSAISPGVLKGLGAALDIAQRTRASGEAPAGVLPTDPETLEALRDLGYVE